MTRSSVLLILLIPLLGLLPCFARAESVSAAGPEQVQEAPGVNAVVRGIISYTRWPVDKPRLGLCIVGETRYGASLHQPVDWFVAEDRLELLETDPGQIPASDCDVVYVGRLGDPEQLRALIARITGQPVLSIGEDEDFCSSGGMFCLERDGQALRFAVNLDAITRSGLQVNPLVLRLTRQLLKQP